MRKQPLISITVQPPAPSPASAPSDLVTPHEMNLADETASRDAYYNAWFATGLEQTKSIFTLASAGAGLALTLLVQVAEKRPDGLAAVWFLLAAAVFCIAAGASVAVMRFNSALMHRLTRREDGSRENELVRRTDLLSRVLFGAGLVFLLFAGVSHLWLDPGSQQKASAIQKK